MPRFRMYFFMNCSWLPLVFDELSTIVFVEMKVEFPFLLLRYTASTVFDLFLNRINRSLFLFRNLVMGTFSLLRLITTPAACDNIINPVLPVNAFS